ncbi:MAG: NFACT RNA binding domain-containing protein [Acutalibacteraceae bacterium]|nr:NFACT RNA binding domain-containing protein [Acutalibacteraceae bacterium]
MAFDGGFLHRIIAELNIADDSHVDKIYQPSKDELVLLLRKKNFTKRLLICTKPGSARIQFTENKYENPASPPMFCMLIRKYLSAARLIRVTQPALERIAELSFSYTNEMGDISEIRLIGEFIGNKTNILLVGIDGTIIDCLRKSDPETADRLLLPGAQYEYPKNQNKLNPLTTKTDEIVTVSTNRGGDISKSLLESIDGFSPLVCREAVYKSEITGNIQSALNDIIKDLKNSGTPTMLIKADGTPYDFSYTDISQYAGEFSKTSFESYSSLLDAFYTARENTERLKHSAADIIKLVTNLRARTERKLAIRLHDLKKCENRETLRIYGELLKANLYRLQNGATFAEVENYYDDMNLIRIPLNPALSPQNNAAKYFKDYKKTYTAEQTLTALTKKDEEELKYFDSVLDSITRSESLSEISEIREELALAGYIKQNGTRKRKNSSVPQFKEYTSVEGYKILVGKNNRQNDYLTTALSAKNDLWFHVKNIPGSHVVVMCRGGEVSDATVMKAAALAAENSKASGSSQIPVDYTPIKFVKKPNGAKPGMVIYTTNKTVYVTPQNLN